ncbi:MAG: MOSC domain-containing protein [Betaproteobacteria bacterium]
MPHIVALYRYPVKGGTPAVCDALTVLSEGRIAGDRALGFRFADSGLPDTAWSKKHGYAALVNTPALARLSMRFDAHTRQLRIALGNAVLADENIDGAGRQRLAAAVERYVLAQPDNPLAGHPERLPLELIGDGVTPRYQDSERGEITLHSRATVAAVAQATGDTDLDELRFRSNIAIDGVAAWSEDQWTGRRLRIGTVDFEVVRTKVRCLATHANPTTGVYDVKVMQTLTQTFGQAQPTFAVALVTHGAGGEMRIGDTVELIDA